MQRRVAAIYLVFFVVMGASAYSVIALADQPAVDVPGQEYENGSAFTAGGQQYLVQVSLEESSGGGGHGGGGGGASVVGSLVYTNESGVNSTTWAGGDTVTYLGDEYDVSIRNGSRVRLVESVNVSGMLRNDSAVYNETVTVNGTESVAYRNGSYEPLDEYLPQRKTFTFEQGAELEYRGNEATIAAIGESEATLQWRGPVQKTIELSEGGNMSLADGTQYFAHFETHGENPTVVIAQNSAAWQDYQGDLAAQDSFKERMNGLWGVVILSGVVGLLVISLAYMPVKG